MSSKKKQNTKAQGRKNNNLIFIILVIAVAAFAVYTAVGGNLGKQDSAASGNQLAADIPTDTDIKILKSEITEQAKFYPYKAGDTYMEVLAVKASDGSIRTALNTCQVCYNSGYGYYKQEGNTLVCQNCGNVFGVDDIEVIKGGCNPVPLLQETKTDDGEYITLKKEYLAAYKDLFADWKK